MAPSFHSLLQELYALDPTLRAREAELIRLITPLLKARPNLKPDRAFLKALRAQLMERAEALSSKTPSLFSHFTAMFKILSYILGGGLVTAGVILVSLSFQRTGPSNTGPIFVSQIDPVKEQAYGSLSKIRSTPTSDTRDVGGGGATSDLTTKMIAPPYMEETRYHYTYKGYLKPPVGQMAVFKRESPAIHSDSIANLLHSFDLGLMSLVGFKDVQLQNISFAEERDSGYAINVDFTNGGITIFQNWPRWKQETGIPLQPSDVPSDETLIALANTFLDAHRISAGEYGTPVVNRFWERQSAETRYVPDTVAITYPQQMDGKTVMSEIGMPIGLEVMVNVRQRLVSGLSGLRVNHFSESLYATQSDTDALMKWAENGGWNSYNPEQARRTVEITLGDPELVYMQTNLFHEDTQLNEELFVPAYRFPIIESTADTGLFREAVLVPLVKDMVQNQYGGPTLFKAADQQESK